jgi:DNA-binding winged helix-turn-helix (wHTH) protein/TolB-like protein/tetratricopeptide (TPR) repeat protein
MPEETKGFYDFGPFRADTVRRLLLRDGQTVPLTSKAFDTLEVLLRNRDRVIEKEELLKAIWPNSFVEEANLTQNVSTLRKALCELPGEHRYIATVPGRGYRFVGEVRTPEIESPASGDRTRALLTGRARWLTVELALAAVLVLVAAGIWQWRLRKEREAARPRSLAVLPFRQLTPRPGDEYLGVGLADAIITRLSNVRELVVRPTDAVLRYASSSADPLSAGRDLRVEQLLSGSIQQAGGRIRITIQLIHVEDGRPLWAETFDETPAGLFDIEDSVSSRVAEKMALHLGGAEKLQLARHYTENVEAWRNYLQGRYSEFRFTRDGMEKAIEYFNHAIALDPGYAIASAGLADAYTTASDWVLSPREALPKAEAAARRALSFDDGLAEAHGSLAHALMHEWRLTESGAEFHRALALSPNNTSIYFGYAEYLTALGRNDEAVTELKKALQLDPLSPAILAMVNWPLYLKGDYEAALESGKAAIKVDPDFWLPYMDNGYNLLALGRYPAAITQFEKARALNPESTINLSGLGATYAQSGRRAEALAVIAQMNDLSGRQYVAPIDIANVYGALGDRDRAMEYLERAYQDQSEMMLFLQLYGKYAGLNNDPRFQELRRRVRTGKTPV